MTAFALTLHCGSSNGGTEPQEPTLANFTLTVTSPANGNITVGAPVDQTCNNRDPACTYPMISDGTMLTLTATADTGHTFTSWGGNCPGTGSGNTCILNMSADRAASAAFVACDPAAFLILPATLCMTFSAWPGAKQRFATQGASGGLSWPARTRLQ